MRNDAVGFFWDDTPPPKAPKEAKPKREPPNPVWLAPDYLPNLDEAKRFDVHVLTDYELWQAQQNKEELILDIECYQNYFLIVFMSYRTGHIVYEELSVDYERVTECSTLNVEKILWILKNFIIVTFNGTRYDLPLLAIALSGKTPLELKHASDQIINQRLRPHEVLKIFKAKKLECNHVDLIEVAPLKASLKAYAGRLHAKRMQDLPFHPSATLSHEQKVIVRWYCVNDTSNTAYLRTALDEELSLRVALSREYNVDLRSKSDAQIAEAVISTEVYRLTGDNPRSPEILPGTIFKYNAPKYLKFQTPLMQWALHVICEADYVVGENGRIKLPKEVKALKLNIADNVYRMGIGGLHSSEKTLTVLSNDKYVLIDRDVVSYYPRIMLNLMLYPKHLGQVFLRIFNGLVTKRLKAKLDKLKIIAGTLKIVINGTFGKLGNKFSAVYAPDLLIQVTITGQLSLMMLIERLALAGIRVVSANTDGIVIYCERARVDECNAIIKQWEIDTRFETEETRYKAIFIRDVNNYIALKESGGFKEKGEFANPWARNDYQEMLKKNPTATICIEAVEKFITDRTPLEETIKSCKNINKFIAVRFVDGGAVKNGEFLGKNVRWYYAKDEVGEIIYAETGKKVAKSDGAKPVMQLPDIIPNDIDYDWYIAEARSYLDSFDFFNETGYNALT